MTSLPNNFLKLKKLIEDRKRSDTWIGNFKVLALALIIKHEIENSHWFIKLKMACRLNYYFFIVLYRQCNIQGSSLILYPVWMSTSAFSTHWNKHWTTHRKYSGNKVGLCSTNIWRSQWFWGFKCHGGEENKERLNAKGTR